MEYQLGVGKYFLLYRADVRPLHEQHPIPSVSIFLKSSGKHHVGRWHF